MSRARDALVLRWVKRRARCVTGTHPNTHVHVSYDEAFMLLEASQEAGALPFMLLDRRLVGAQASCPTRTWRIERGAPKRAVLGGVGHSLLQHHADLLQHQASGRQLVALKEAARRREFSV